MKCLFLFYKGSQTQHPGESFDSVENEAEEVNPNASMTALTSIDQSDVNHATIKSVAEQLLKVADNTIVSDMVSHYSSRLLRILHAFDTRDACASVQWCSYDNLAGYTQTEIDAAIYVRLWWPTVAQKFLDRPFNTKTN